MCVLHVPASEVTPHFSIPLLLLLIVLSRQSQRYLRLLSLACCGFKDGKCIELSVLVRCVGLHLWIRPLYTFYLLIISCFMWTCCHLAKKLPGFLVQFLFPVVWLTFLGPRGAVSLRGSCTVPSPSRVVFATEGSVILQICWYKYVPHSDVAVNDGPHIRRWSHSIIITGLL